MDQALAQKLKTSLQGEVGTDLVEFLISSSATSRTLIMFVSLLTPWTKQLN